MAKNPRSKTDRKIEDDGQVHIVHEAVVRQAVEKLEVQEDEKERGGQQSVPRDIAEGEVVEHEVERAADDEDPGRLNS